MHRKFRDTPVRKLRDSFALSLALGVLARLLLLGGKDLWHDEALRLLIAASPLPDLLEFARRMQFGSSLFFFALHFWLVPLKWLGAAGGISAGHDALARLFPLAGGVLALAFSLKLAAAVLPVRMHLPAMLLIALLPFGIEYSQEGREYAWLAALGLWGSAGLWRAIARRGSRWTVPYGVSLALAAMVHPGAWIWWAGQAAAVALSRQRVRLLRPFLIATVPAAAVAAIGLLATGEVVSQRLAAAFERPPVLVYLGQTLMLFSSGHHIGPVARWVVPVLAVVLAAAGAAGLWAKRGPGGTPGREAATFLSAQVLVPVAAVYLGIVAGLSTQLRYVTAASVPLAVLVVAGAGSFPRGWRSVLLAMMLAQAAESFYRWHLRPPDLEPTFCLLSKKPLRSVAAMVRLNWREGDVVVHVSTASMVPMLWMAPDLPHRYVTANPDLAPVVAEKIIGPPQPLAPVLRRARRVWLVSCPWRFRDVPVVPAEYRPALDRYCDPPLRYSFRGVELYLGDVVQ